MRPASSKHNIYKRGPRNTTFKNEDPGAHPIAIRLSQACVPFSARDLVISADIYPGLEPYRPKGGPRTGFDLAAEAVAALLSI
jgi:hypothetical protein